MINRPPAHGNPDTPLFGGCSGGHIIGAVGHESLTDLSCVLPSQTLSTLIVVALKDLLPSLSIRPALPSIIRSEGVLLGSCGGRRTAQANADTGAIRLSMIGSTIMRIFVIA